MTKFIKLKKEDAAEIAEIHISAFTGFFLTSLGKNVLRVFYSSLFQDEFIIAWGIKLNDEFVGFFVATTSPSGIYSKVFRKHFDICFI